MAVILLATAAMTPAGASAAAAITTPAESPVAGPPAHRPVSTTDQLARLSAQSPAAPLDSSSATTTLVPFLTRPYLHAHPVTSVFDHCNPDYSVDGRICEFDGTVALQSNGVDPTFTRGYAITPGRSNYLYYDGHNGWDIGLNYENLLAAADGTVVIAGIDPNNGGFGLNVTIDHGNGFTTRYAHMSQIAVSPGQHVLRGQGIGVSGNTGNSTGPHLHFGLYITSPWTAIDPWGWSGSTPDPSPADTGDMWIGGNPQDPGASAPTQVTATISGQMATVSWTPPSYDAGSSIGSYTITSIPAGFTTTMLSPATTGTLAGLAYATAYTFTVTATNALGPGQPSSPSTSVTTGPAPFKAMYTMDGYGGIHPVESPSLNFSAYWSGWNIARSMALKADGGGGYVLDGYGGVHAFGSAAGQERMSAYWSGWNIARDIAVLPDGNDGYVLDGWGGLHPFTSGGRPMPADAHVTAYWQGWDIARKLVVFPDGTGGYVLDGYGRLHPFSIGSNPMPAGAQLTAYWSWDIARGITLVPGTSRAGYVLDGYGGLHSFAPVGIGQPSPTGGSYWWGWDIARAVVASPTSTSTAPAGWVLDGYGGVHPYGLAGTPRVSAYWSGLDIAHGMSAQ